MLASPSNTKKATDSSSEKPTESSPKVKHVVSTGEKSGSKWEEIQKKKLEEEEEKKKSKPTTTTTTSTTTKSVTPSDQDTKGNGCALCIEKKYFLCFICS